MLQLECYRYLQIENYRYSIELDALRAAETAEATISKSLHHHHHHSSFRIQYILAGQFNLQESVYKEGAPEWKEKLGEVKERVQVTTTIS